MKKPAPCKLAVILNLVVASALLTAGGASAAEHASATPAATAATAPAAKTPPAKAGGKLCPPEPCKTGHNCSNDPFEPTACWTTEYGPARADVIIGAQHLGAVRSPNMLYCDGNTYALCFFSGPPTPTGTSSSNNALPCLVSGEIATCTCQAYTSGPNFVDINGILNRGAYFEAVSQCGHDGSKCKNIVNCGPRGDLKGCANYPPAKVCKYIKDQNPIDPKVSLWPKADLISTFSFAMSPFSLDTSPKQDGPYQLGSTPCTGLYAGCMTASCTYGAGHKPPTTDGELVTCQCPTYNGPNYQIGQSKQSCSITGGSGSYVWSAANTVPAKSGGK
jgi:hypothetical protein